MIITFTEEKSRTNSIKLKSTVKLGYNKLGYSEHSVITNTYIYLVGSGHFMTDYPCYNEQNPVITNKFSSFQCKYSISHI